MQQTLGLQLSSQLPPDSSRTYHCLSCLAEAHSLLSWALCASSLLPTPQNHILLCTHTAVALFKKIFLEEFMP